MDEQQLQVDYFKNSSDVSQSIPLESHVNAAPLERFHAFTWFMHCNLTETHHLWQLRWNPTSNEVTHLVIETM